MQIYMIDIDNDGHEETYAFYSTMELAEEALEDILNHIPSTMHSLYTIRMEYLDRFHIKEKN